jgi:hypothetical protein
MLWFKAWAESRTRFAIGLGLIIAATAFIIGWQDGRALFAGVHRTLFTLLAFVLGMGGLLRESEVGTSAFTLSLPVSRTRLTIVRSVVGLAELAALAAAPVVVIAVAAIGGRHAMPVSQAVTLALRWIAGGSALFGLGLFASATVPGEYNGFVAAVAVHFGHTVTTQFIRLAKPPLMPYMFTIQEIMSGLRPALAVPTAAAVAIAACLIAAASAWTDRKDF